MPDPPETGATRPDPEARAGARRIVITGFMCAGKTTVGRELARRLSLPFLDLDDLVTEREGRTPAELIDERGEAACRDAETRALRSALGAGAAFVLALGGGAWTLERNRDLLRAHGARTVWLDAPFELCWRRAAADGGASRPFARDRRLAEKLYDERRAAYSTAELHIDVSEGRGAAGLAAEVARALPSE